MMIMNERMNCLKGLIIPFNIFSFADSLNLWQFLKIFFFEWENHCNKCIKLPHYT